MPVLKLSELNDRLVPGTPIALLERPDLFQIHRNGYMFFERVCTLKDAEAYIELDKSTPVSNPDTTTVWGVLIARHLFPKMGSGGSARVDTSLQKRCITLEWGAKFLVPDPLAVYDLFKEIRAAHPE